MILIIVRILKYWRSEGRLQSFNKAIVALRVAMSKIAGAIEDEEENILVYELLMHHKRLLHDQIDNIMKAKRKYAKNIFSTNNVKVNLVFIFIIIIFAKFL